MRRVRSSVLAPRPVIEPVDDPDAEDPPLVTGGAPVANDIRYRQAARRGGLAAGEAPARALRAPRGLPSSRMCWAANGSRTPCARPRPKRSRSRRNRKKPICGPRRRACPMASRARSQAVAHGYGPVAEGAGAQTFARNVTDQTASNVASRVRRVMPPPDRDGAGGQGGAPHR